MVSLRLRVGVVGARRRRQGLGFHLARFCAEAGADVVGIVGTSPETVDEARRALLPLGIEPAGHLRTEDLLRHGRPDLLVVASPSRTHEALLARALDAGVHVLCEKPLLWGGADLAARSRRIAEAFLAKGLHLAVNAQWPLTLPTYRDLFPGGPAASPPRAFAMHTAPDGVGEELLPEGLPHPLSILAAALPDPAARVEHPRVRLAAPDGSRVDVAFRYVAAGASVEAEVLLHRGGAPPRPSGYGFDGRMAERRIEMPGYRFRLEGGGRSLPLPDPTPLLVRAVLARVSSGAPPALDPHAWPGMAHLAAIHAAWPSGAGQAGAGPRAREEPQV